MQTDVDLKTDIQKAVDKLNTLICQAAYKGLTIKYDIRDNNPFGAPNYPIINVKLQRIQEI